MTIARGTGIPMVLVNDLIVAGHDIGQTAAELESHVLASGDDRRGGGTWMGGLQHELELLDRPAAFDGRVWSWANRGDAVAGHVTAGGGFVRCVYDARTTPAGPSTARRAAAFWDFVADEAGIDTAGLTAATDLTP
jgi:hypothetical protein